MTVVALTAQQLNVLRAVVSRGIAGMPMRDLPPHDRCTAWSLNGRNLIEPSRSCTPPSWFATRAGMREVEGLPVATERELEVGNGKHEEAAS